MKNKKLKAGFVLCIVGATLRLAIAAFLILMLPFPLAMVNLDGYVTIDRLIRILQSVPLGLIFLGLALAMIILSVHGKKGGRKEAAGGIVVSCLMLSPLALVGSILMLRAIPKQQAAAPKAPVEGEVPAAETQIPAPMSEGEPLPTGAVTRLARTFYLSKGDTPRPRILFVILRSAQGA